MNHLWRSLVGASHLNIEIKHWLEDPTQYVFPLPHSIWSNIVSTLPGPQKRRGPSACSTVALSTPPAKIMIDQSQSLIGSRSDRWLEYIKGAPNLAFILATTHHHERSSRCTQQLQLGLFILSSRVTPLVVIPCHVFLHLVFTFSISFSLFLPSPL